MMYLIRHSQDTQYSRTLVLVDRQKMVLTLQTQFLICVWMQQLTLNYLHHLSQFVFITRHQMSSY